jgi:hypothetical protein
MRESPLGRTVQLVAKKRPELFPEQCLEYAKQALDKAAGPKVYRVNALSAKEEARGRIQLRVMVQK